MIWRAAVITLLLLATGSATHAQLRPLEAIRWQLFDEQATLAVEAGAARLLEQRASLAGTEGDLWEAGNFAFAWRTGRVVLEASGTAQRFFRETSRFDTPCTDVEPSDDGRRHDSGDYRVSTAVRLTPGNFPVTGVVRFGTRLPTTDNKTGLDRDAVDFFTTLGGHLSRASLRISGEAGLGIHTSREDRFEQDDLLLYAARMEYRTGTFSPSFAVLGQKHGSSHEALRGLEDLGEMRAGLQVGRSSWIKVELVRGYETFSPAIGLILSGGILR